MRWSRPFNYTTLTHYQLFVTRKVIFRADSCLLERRSGKIPSQRPRFLGNCRWQIRKGTNVAVLKHRKPVDGEALLVALMPVHSSSPLIASKSISG